MTTATRQGPYEKLIMTSEDLKRTLSRMAHQVIETNRGTGNLLLSGIHTRGYPLAHRLAHKIAELGDNLVPVEELNIGPFRDDIAGQRFVDSSLDNKIDITGKRVIIVDDVLFTGRSVRAAMDALSILGRPGYVELAVLIDRGHRELPIKPDYVGKNLPTSLYESVYVRLVEIDGKDEGVIVGGAE